jgi:hypothetical protein
MARGDKVIIPESCPKAGETYKHYKGDLYRIVLLAEHSNDNEWMVVYEAMYEHPDAPYFTRPLRQWHERIEWKGEMKKRFEKE